MSGIRASPNQIPVISPLRFCQFTSDSRSTPSAPQNLGLRNIKCSICDPSDFSSQGRRIYFADDKREEKKEESNLWRRSRTCVELFDKVKKFLCHSDSDCNLEQICCLLAYLSNQVSWLDLESEQANMQRLSISSTPSCSTVGGGVDDIESLGDLYVWGELWSDGSSTDGDANTGSSKVDILFPKPLETDVVLDVHQISCGVRHVSLVTRQGEVFTWGEESGGRLGHGIEKDLNQPRLVEFLAVTNVDFVACGEYHTCAVSTSGDLFTWGDGTHNAGLLGQGTDASHWIPKRISGPVDGLQVLSVGCGTWHSAMITSTGRLFTFGDGKFGALGHGDRDSVSYPKEVQQLCRMKTIKVACGVWHTAAIVEVANTSGTGGNMLPRKLFTWGDGDKYRLGHGSKETYLLPTCVSALIDYNFHQIACGHTLTVALTTSGHVFTMGSNAYGQLGNPKAEGKAPCLVQEKLVGEFVEEIACGAYHVAILTSRSEVFSWGKGANGQLGHGDVEDRKSPTLIESLKDRHVKSISCGSNFSSSICIHKWVSGADQSVCCGCRQAFGFTRKRHNCYNCGLVHCHACSSRKALKAALAPTPNKPHRVCDACYTKLKSGGVGSASNLSKKVTTAPRRSIDVSRIERSDKEEMRSMRLLPSPSLEPVKYTEVRSRKPGSKNESVSIIRASQVPSFRNMQDVAFPSSLSTLQNTTKAMSAIPPAPQLPVHNSSLRSASSNTKKHGPLSTAAPLSSRGAIESLRKSNEVLSEEVGQLQNQIKTLRHRSKTQHEKNQNLQQNAKEATALASEQYSSYKIAKLKEYIEKMPPDISESDGLKAIQKKVENFLGENKTKISSYQHSLSDVKSAHISDTLALTSASQGTTSESPAGNSTESSPSQGADTSEPHAADTSEHANNSDFSDMPQSSDSASQDTNESPTAGRREPTPSQGTDSRPPRSTTMKNDRAAEVIEQFEPGVYVTVLPLRNGAKIFKRVKFSKRKFAEQQAEEWWKGNKERVLRKYQPPQLAQPMKASIPDDDPTSGPPPLHPCPPPSKETNS